ncbi:MAG: hypothetical protein AAGF20_04765 [Pseudomonadota bacterium]
MGRFPRRKILSGLGLTAVAIGGTSYLGCAIVEPEQEAALVQAERLDVLLDDLVDAARIGRAARADFGLETLQHAATRAHALQRALDISCAASRRDYLRQASAADFKAGAIVVCDRFVLSEKEVIVAGLRA